MIALLLILAQFDGGTFTPQANVGEWDSVLGQYTTYLWQGQPGSACLNLTKYIQVCSSGARSTYNASTGGNGALQMYAGDHHGVQLSDWHDFSPIADDDFELGTGTYAYNSTPYAWKRVTAYEHVFKPRTIVCPGGSGVCVSTSTPTTSSLRFDCQDENGCEWVPGESITVWGASRAPFDGAQVCVWNVGSYQLHVADTDGVAELDGDFDGGPRSSLCLEYVADRWVERSRSAP